MRFLLAAPDTGVQQTDLNGLMLALGPEQALEASRRAESEPVLQVSSDPIRLVRLMAPGDESLTFSALLGMIPDGAEPLALPSREPRYTGEGKVKEEDDSKGHGCVPIVANQAPASALAGATLAEKLKGREDHPFTIAEAVELLVEAHLSDEFAYREVIGEVTIKVPVRLLVANAKSDEQARELIADFSDGNLREVDDPGLRCGILWDPVRPLQDALDAINAAESPADADWEIAVESVAKLTQTQMRAFARKLVVDLQKQVAEARRLRLDEAGATLETIMKQVMVSNA